MTTMPIPRFSSWKVIPVLALLIVPACAHEEPKPTAASVRVVPEPAPAPKAARPAAAPPQVAQAPAKVDDAAIYFDFDSSTLGDDARKKLQEVARTAKTQRESLVIEGNCDETGTTEYNLALGEQRARSAKDYLSHLGVASDRMQTTSYGSQRPRYPGHDDDSRAKNRRDDIRVQ
jgi:peptidoglycan-associated lipoprotein